MRRTCSAFTDRDTLLAYEQALEHASDLDTAFEVSSNLQLFAVPPSFPLSMCSSASQEMSL